MTNLQISRLKSIVIAMNKEIIACRNKNDYAWICVCGNEPEIHGFYSCDQKGVEMEPLIGSSWDGLYVCGKCGRIIDMETCEVIGRNVSSGGGSRPVV